MATLYVGEQFWTDRVYEVTARSQPGQYPSRSMFIEAVNKWLIKHDISYKWQGESTHDHDGVITYQYHVRIPVKHDRTLFALRWA
jgi:hypothetical protein